MKSKQKPIQYEIITFGQLRKWLIDSDVNGEYFNEVMNFVKNKILKRKRKKIKKLKEKL